jgi:Alpha 1,4-glycosyltransferase conserved region/Glycosyltransferase sugar-binding region containing DXD motif
MHRTSIIESVADRCFGSVSMRDAGLKCTFRPILTRFWRLPVREVTDIKSASRKVISTILTCRITHLIYLCLSILIGINLISLNATPCSISDIVRSDIVSIAASYHVGALAPPCRRIIGVWTTSPSTWSSWNDAAVESIFRFDPCAQLFLHSNSLPLTFFDTFNEFGFFVEVVRYDLEDLAGNGPGSKWVKNAKVISNRSHHHSVHESDFIRTLLLYHEGGSYLDVDHFMLPLSATIPLSYENITGAEACMEDNPDCFETHAVPGLRTMGNVKFWQNGVRHCGANGVLLNWKRNHPIMEAGLLYFDDNYDPTCWGCGGPRLLGRTIPKYPDQVTLFPQESLYPIHYRQSASSLTNPNSKLCSSIASNALGFHLYGKSVSVSGVKPVAGSLAACLRRVTNLFEVDKSGIHTAVTSPLLHISRMSSPEIGSWSTSDICSRQSADPNRFVAVTLLTWKRVSTLSQILTSYGSSRYVRDVVVWNNNPNVTITVDDVSKAFAKASHTKFKPCVRVRNAGPSGNFLFLGRYIACLSSGAPVCIFQDDDWVVQDSEHLMHLAQRQPDRVHSTTNGIVVEIENNWKFREEQIGLDAQFTWVGTGATASRRLVNRFFQQLLFSRISPSDIMMADFYFSTWMNVNHDILEGTVVELTRDQAFSGPEGTTKWRAGLDRNVKYIWHALSLLKSALREANGQRNMFSPLIPKTFDPYWLRELDSQPGCLVSNPLKAIFRVAASPFGSASVRILRNATSLGGHLLSSGKTFGKRYRLCNPFDGNLKTYLQLHMSKACHNCSLELIEPFAAQKLMYNISGGIISNIRLKYSQSKELVHVSNLSNDHFPILGLVEFVLFEVCSHTHPRLHSLSLV